MLVCAYAECIMHGFRYDHGHMCDDDKLFCTYIFLSAKRTCVTDTLLPEYETYLHRNMYCLQVRLTHITLICRTLY